MNLCPNLSLKRSANNLLSAIVALKKEKGKVQSGKKATKKSFGHEVVAHWAAIME
jgi:hypothetical protein